MNLKRVWSYYSRVFGLGFAFGTVRSVFLLNHMSESTAILIELPFMLGFSWITSKRVFKTVSSKDRVLEGSASFLILQGSELVLALLLGGMTLRQHVHQQLSPPHVYGLWAQIGFALIPWLQGYGSP